MHPVVEFEIREIEFECRKIEHDNPIQQLASKIGQIEKENARLAQIHSRIERFEREHLHGSIPHHSSGDSSS